MKKRILSLVLCLVMVVSLLPTQAHAEEGEECLGSCNHIHWGDAICDGCGLCSADCPKGGDCWYESHCKECGACYMSADNWCDECGWCQDCMQEAHCQDCGRCFVGESKDELCEGCQRCSNCVDSICVECHKCSGCVDGFCEECNMCSDCFEESEHCQSCLTHLPAGGACDDCGYCDDCAEAEGLHCEDCGACFEGGAERCPIHEDDPHCKDCAGDYCEECGKCEFTKSDLVLCDYCGKCTDCCREISEDEGCSTGDVCVENSDWDDHFCDACGVCFCDDNRCKTCDLCKDCCKNAGICTDCDCSETAGVHHHKYDATKWVIDQNSHWNECRVCHEKINTAAHKDADGDGYCDVCKIDQANPLYISSQPKDLVRKVTDEDLKETDPDHPENSRARFSVKAQDMAGRTLSYQWYWVLTNKKTGVKYGPNALENGVDYVKGATTDTLDIGVPIEGCKYTYQFFCEITATAADGTSVTITSRYARLRVTHNYGFFAATDLSTLSKVTVILDSNGAKITSYQGSKYHNRTCIGMNCGHTKLPATTEHNYGFKEDLGTGHTTTQPGVTKYFYLMECPECGQNDLRSSDTEDTIPHFITLNAPEGAYAFDVHTEETVTYAKKGAEIELFAPTLNDQGHIFTGWEVVEGDVTLIPNHNPGIYTFYMPSDNVELKALYDSSRKPVESIKVNTIKVNGKDVPLVNRTVTVKVGDTIQATAALTPDTDIMDERVLWNVMGTVGDSHTMLHFTGSSGSGTLTEPTASPVQLEALKVTGDSKLYLRATAYASQLGTDLKAVSDFIYVNIVADSEHVCEYKVTTVHPTCTLKGYTLYTCKDAECGKSYKTQFTESLGGHKDTDGDGLCDNPNKNTGKACGFKLSAGGSDDFVGQKKIGKAELTVITPVTGQKPANALKASASESYTVANTQWMTADGQALDPNGTFAPGTVYTVKVTLEANAGCAFQLKAFSNTKILRPAAAVKATEFQINTVTVKPGNGSSKDSVNLIYTFTATGAGTVTPTGEYDFQVLNGTAYDNSTGTKIIDNNIETPVKVLAGTVVKVAADDMTSMGLYFDKWEVVSGGITLADENSATTTFTMPEEAVKVLAVYERRVTSLSINKTAATLKVGGEETLTATADPAVYNTEVEWSSSDESVATVSAGKVTAKAVGTATITAMIYTKFTTATPEYKSVTCTVTVVPKDTSIYTVTVQDDGRGSASASPASAAAGAEIALSATANSGYHFKEWKVVSGGVSITNNKFTMPADDVTVKAIFEKNSGSSGGSSGGTTAYTVTVLSSKNGAVTSSHKTAAKGTTVTLTVSPDKGYALETLTVLDKSGKEIKLTEKNGKYTFTMPASSVEVEAAFKAAESGNPFVDVPSGSYYEDAVIWAVKEGVTGGTSATTFNPNGICTRAQAVTFLWRAAGSPAPKSTTMPFTDVKTGSYYEQAVLWAVENGITKGTGDTTFSPNATCSRAQIVTFLWRSQKSPAAGSVNPFTDVKSDAYYADAVLWAVKESVTSGTTATTFTPNADCTRAQIVTFIYRALAE